MEQRRLKVTKYMMTLALTTTLSIVGCEKKSTEEPMTLTQTMKQLDLADILSETNCTRAKYNLYLQQIGYDKLLTNQDIKMIEQNTNAIQLINKIIAIRLKNNETIQVGMDYVITEKDESGIELRMSPIAGTDLFTSEPLPGVAANNHILGSVYEYIVENEIEPIGYTTQKLSTWSNQDREFIRENYGEEILSCLQENGFPLPIYDVNDFYNTYKSKSKNLEKTLEQ